MENSKGNFVLEKILMAIIIIVLIIAGTVIFIYLNNNKSNTQQSSISEQSSNIQNSNTTQKENKTTQDTTSKSNSSKTQNTTNTQTNQDKYSQFINENVTQQAYEMCIQKIKNQLKNPASLQVVSQSVSYTYNTKEVSTCKAKDLNELRKIAKENELNEYYIFFDIDISAQNSFGGNARKDVRGCCKVTNENSKVYVSCSISGLDTY